MKIWKNLVVTTILSLTWLTASADDPVSKSNKLSANSEIKYSHSLEELKSQLKKNKTEAIILEKLIKQREEGNIQPQVCGGSNPCYCVPGAGSYGYCTTRQECAEIGGFCTSR